MKKRRRNLVAAVAVAGAAAIAVTFAVVSGGARTAAPDTEARGSQVQAIEVHGDWTIEVRSPGGRLLRRARFANFLVQALFLRQVLARKYSPGAWRVVLNEAKIGDYPCLNNRDPWACVVAEPSFKAEAGWQFTNLNVKDDGKLLVLSGVATAQRKGKITSVYTLSTRCPASVAPASCDGAKGSSEAMFTYADIKAIPVEPEQKISVTVKISFK